MSNKGFSLIELMIVVGIIGILAAIAYPSYQQQVLRSHRAEGKAMLMEAQAKQERFFSSYNTYTTSTDGAGSNGLGYSADPALSENQYYSLSIDAPTAACPISTCYSLTITAKNSQTKDSDCLTYTLSGTGRKTASDLNGERCWDR